MMTEQIIFWMLAILTFASALGVVLMRNPINSVMSLLLAMIAIAGLFVLMGAYLVALFQIIIYVGAVLVLFLFVVMLLNLKAPRPRQLPNPTTFAISAFAVLLTAGTVFLAWRCLISSEVTNRGKHLLAGKGIMDIAIDLFSRHLLVFELTSVLLFVAVIGAVLISRKEKTEHES